MWEHWLYVFVEAHFATLFGFALALFLFARIIQDHARATTSIAWFLVIVLMPYVGVPAYLLFGGRKLRHLATRKPLLERRAQVAPTLPLSTAALAFARLFEAFQMPPPRAGNRLELIADGAVAYARLRQQIEHAQTSIDCMTFILGDDAVGRAIVDQLAIKASQGVRVRLLVDALGSLRARAWLLRRLRRAGGEVAIFMRVLPFHRRWSAQLRNHRKLVVFDGRLALTGGMNIAAEYMGPDAGTVGWMDTCIECEGPVIGDLAALFASDWAFATGTALEQAPEAVMTPGTNIAQLVASGPDVAGDPVSDVIAASIYNARRRVWIVSPYFIPDDALLRALAFKSRIGIDVRLIVPRHSNHRVADFARNRILRELAAAGAHVYEHPQRMIHAKHILIDDDIAIAGSMNMDARSLYLNYEVALFAYSGAFVGELASWMKRLTSECEVRTAAPPGRLGRLLEDLCWLFSPLL